MTATTRRHRKPAIVLATALGLGLLLTTSALAVGSNAAGPRWQPAASEKLIKLPATHLKKSLDHDFARSPLAAAIRDGEENLTLKAQTLADLQTAIASADGELVVELRHQFLVEKRAYVELMKQNTDLQRRHLTTRQRTLEKLLGRLQREDGEMTPARAQLVALQGQARERFEANVTKVDLAVMSAPAAPESRYAREYAANLTAIEQLMHAIQRHPMSQQPNGTATAMSKQDFVRQMLADAEAGLALLDQEQTILGYMAKLVALDAMNLSDQMIDADLADSAVPQPSGAVQAVKFFVN